MVSFTYAGGSDCGENVAVDFIPVTVSQGEGEDERVVLMNKIEGLLFQAIEGVSYLAPKMCTDPEEKNKVPCVVIGAETQAVLDALQVLLPEGARVDGVLIKAIFMGPIETNPRMSTGG